MELAHDLQICDHFLVMLEPVIREVIPEEPADVFEVVHDVLDIDLRDKKLCVRAGLLGSFGVEQDTARGG